MADHEAVVAAVRANLDYEKAFAEHLELEGKGAERMALCVFHDNRDTPALSVNVEEGLYHCKNPDCGQSGDIFTFLMRVRSATFPDVLAELARGCGLGHLLDQPSAPRATAVEAPPPEAIARLARGYVPPEDGLSLADFAALTRAAKATNGNGTHPPTMTARFESDGVVREIQIPVPAADAPLARDPSKPRSKKSAQEMPPIDPALVAQLHQRLLASPARLEFLATRRGLTLETLARFQIGHDGSRFTIPVKDADGIVRNVRRYLPDAKESKFKMISWRQGYGKARLFPLDHLSDDEPMFVFEGEMDCLLARQLGLNAYTGTSGAETWRDEWNDCFVGRKVAICYDADSAGAAGARRVAMSLREVAGEIKVVRIPLAEPKGADFTDYIHGHGHTVGDFLALVDQTPTWYADGIDSPTAQPEPIDLHLSQASEAEYHDVPIRVNVMVSGKTTAPYLVPREVRVGCSPEVRGTMPMCERCSVNKANAPVTKQMEFTSNEALRLVGVNQAALDRTVKQSAGVPGKCTFAGYDVIQAMNVEKISLIPEITFSEATTPYVTRIAYYLGHGLETNRSYVMTGLTVAEPGTQEATHLIQTATPSQSNIDAFSLSPDVVARLKAFQPREGGVRGLWSHLHTIYSDLERVTKIYERRDLMLTTDLVYHSALSFHFQGDLLQRGWTEGLIVGDSRTGKTTIVQRLMNHYKAGEMTSAENTSAAGLIGGLHQLGTSWVLQWGRVPLNDRRLLFVDEASGMPTEGIGRMSSMRSSGIAEIIKVHTERTTARTRMIWVANARSNRSLSSYGQGVLAVKELIGAPADIARFDIVATASTSDVALSTVNAPREGEEPEIYTSDLCHQRVMWAWSRTASQITWGEGASSEVLRIATEQGQKYRYATEIPLVEPNEQRVKLARLAVATAIMFFSASDDGQQVIVLPEHVQFAAQFLEQLYAKPSLAFTDYAEQQRRQYVISDPQKVREILDRNPLAPRMLMEQQMMTQKDLMEVLGYDELKETRIAISTLREEGFLSRYGTSGYVKTPAAIILLRQMMARGQPPAPYAAAAAAHAQPDDEDDRPAW